MIDRTFTRLTCAVFTIAFLIFAGLWAYNGFGPLALMCCILATLCAVTGATA